MGKDNQHIITGLDIGSGKIKLAVAQVKTDEQDKRTGIYSQQNQKIDIIGLVELQSAGITKGNVNNIENLVTNISLAMEKMERMVGFPSENVVVNISGDHIRSSQSKGVIAISHPNGEITAEDVNRVIEAARSVTVPPNYEILHIIPKIFNIDSQKGIKDPVGMSGVRLEAEVQIIQGLSMRIKNFTHAIYRTSVDIDDMVLSSLAASEAVLTIAQKEMGVLVLDIGHTLTNGAIFEEGRAIHIFTIPIGSSHITADLAIGLRSSIETAEIIKVKEGTLDLANIRKSEIIELKHFSKIDSGTFSRQYVGEIIEARVDEIFDYVVRELKQIGKFRKLPAGAVLTGGGAKMPYLVEFSKDKLELPASLGLPQGYISSIENIHNPSFAVVCGLLLWSARGYGEQDKKGFKLNLKIGNMGGKIKKWVKALLP